MRLRRVKQLVGRGGPGGGRKVKEVEVEGGREGVGVREKGGGGGTNPRRREVTEVGLPHGQPAAHATVASPRLLQIVRASQSSFLKVL